MKKEAFVVALFTACSSLNVASEPKSLSLSPDFCISAFRSLMSKDVFSLDIRATDVSDSEVKVLMRYQNEDNFPEDSVGKCKLVDGNIVIFPPEVTYKYNR